MGTLGIRRFGSARRAIGLVAAGVVAVGLSACEPLPTDGRDLGLSGPQSFSVPSGWEEWVELTVSNAGSAAATGVKLGALVPEEVSITAVYQADGAEFSLKDCTVTAAENPVRHNIVSCDMADIGPGESDLVYAVTTGSPAGFVGEITYLVISDMADGGGAPNFVQSEIEITEPPAT